MKISKLNGATVQGSITDTATCLTIAGYSDAKCQALDHIQAAIDCLATLPDIKSNEAAIECIANLAVIKLDIQGSC